MNNTKQYAFNDNVYFIGDPQCIVKAYHWNRIKEKTDCFVKDNDFFNPLGVALRFNTTLVKDTTTDNCLYLQSKTLSVINLNYYFNDGWYRDYFYHTCLKQLDTFKHDCIPVIESEMTVGIITMLPKITVHISEQSLSIYDNHLKLLCNFEDNHINKEGIWK